MENCNLKKMPKVITCSKIAAPFVRNTDRIFSVGPLILTKDGFDISVHL